MPDSARVKASDELPVSTSSVDAATADGADAAEKAKAAGRQGKEGAKQGLNTGLDKVYPYKVYP